MKLFKQNNSIPLKIKLKPYLFSYYTLLFKKKLRIRASFYAKKNAFFSKPYCQFFFNFSKIKNIFYKF